MMKKVFSTAMIWTLIAACAITVYALTTLFKTHNEPSKNSPKQVFDFVLTTDMQENELGPGDSFVVSPVIKNAATMENISTLMGEKQFMLWHLAKRLLL